MKTLKHASATASIQLSAASFVNGKLRLVDGNGMSALQGGWRCICRPKVLGPQCAKLESLVELQPWRADRELACVATKKCHGAVARGAVREPSPTISASLRLGEGGVGLLGRGEGGTCHRKLSRQSGWHDHFTLHQGPCFYLLPAPSC